MPRASSPSRWSTIPTSTKLPAASLASFNDYVAEIQRSIGFFSSVNRDAKIARIVGVGNGFKLAGLQSSSELLAVAREMRENGRNAIWVASDLLHAEAKA